MPLTIVDDSAENALHGAAANGVGIPVTYSAGVHTFTVTSSAAPNDWQTGDLIVVMLGMQTPTDGSGDFPASPSGWTQFSTTNYDCGGGRRFKTASYWRIRQGGDASSYTFVCTTASAASQQCGYVRQVVRGNVKEAKLSVSGTYNGYVGSPYYPINGQNIIPAKYTKARDAAMCMLMSVSMNPATATSSEPFRWYYTDGYPDVATTSGAVLPVSFGVGGGYPGGDWAITALRYDVTAKQNAGMFGARLF